MEMQLALAAAQRLLKSDSFVDGQCSGATASEKARSILLRWRHSCDPRPHFFLGVACDKMGHKEEAMAAYQRTLELQPCVRLSSTQFLSFRHDS